MSSSSFNIVDSSAPRGTTEASSADTPEELVLATWRDRQFTHNSDVYERLLGKDCVIA